MADNYLERKMEEYRSRGKGVRATVRCSARPKGELRVKYPVLRVFVAGEITPFLKLMVETFRGVDARVAFCSGKKDEGTSIAQNSGARFYPASGDIARSTVNAFEDILGLWGGADVVIDMRPEPDDSFLNCLDGKSDIGNCLFVFTSETDKVPAEKITAKGFALCSVLAGNDKDIAARMALFLAHPSNRMTAPFTVSLP